MNTWSINNAGSPAALTRTERGREADGRNLIERYPGGHSTPGLVVPQGHPSWIRPSARPSGRAAGPAAPRLPHRQPIKGWKDSLAVSTPTPNSEGGMTCRSTSSFALFGSLQPRGAAACARSWPRVRLLESARELGRRPGMEAPGAEVLEGAEPAMAQVRGLPCCWLLGPTPACPSEAPGATSCNDPDQEAGASQAGGAGARTPAMGWGVPAFARDIRRAKCPSSSAATAARCP